MKVVLLHDEVADHASPDEADTYAQLAAVETALASLGHTHSRIPITLNLAAAADRIRAERPDLVFNLAESVGASGRLIHLAPSLLDSLGLPYTGCPTDAVYCTSNKLLAKRLLAGAEISTPRAFTPDDLRRRTAIEPGRYILKSVWEHASRGLDDDSVVTPSDAASLAAALTTRLPALAGEGFAEQYVDGREFNLSLLCGECLPPAEIVFEGYDAARPRIVGYRAKWDEDSFEYHHTPRRFDFPASDRPLLTALESIARDCWRLFSLRGYARVDFRVDPRGRPWVLEVNTNPCLSPDAGFAAALERAGLTMTDAVSRIIGASLP